MLKTNLDYYILLFFSLTLRYMQSHNDESYRPIDTHSLQTKIVTRPTINIYKQKFILSVVIHFYNLLNRKCVRFFLPSSHRICIWTAWRQQKTNYLKLIGFILLFSRQFFIKWQWFLHLQVKNIFILIAVFFSHEKKNNINARKKPKQNVLFFKYKNTTFFM